MPNKAVKFAPSGRRLLAPLAVNSNVSQSWKIIMNNTSNIFTHMLAKYSASIFDKNVTNYVNLYSEDVLIFDMWNDWYVQGLNQWQDMAKGWFESLNTERVLVTASEIQSIQTGDIIVGHAILRFAAISSEGVELRYLNNRVSVCMRNFGGEWKIFHQHSSVPIDSKSIQVKFHFDQV